MGDTREMMAARLSLPRMPAGNEDLEDIPAHLRPSPRFSVGDVLLMAVRPDVPFKLVVDPYWDYEFGGWLLAPGLIGVHECNYIYASEREQWDPHPDGLWSYWTRRR